MDLRQDSIEGWNILELKRRFCFGREWKYSGKSVKTTSLMVFQEVANSSGNSNGSNTKLYRKANYLVRTRTKQRKLFHRQGLKGANTIYLPMTPRISECVQPGYPLSGCRLSSQVCTRHLPQTSAAENMPQSSISLLHYPSTSSTQFPRHRCSFQ